MWSAELRSKNIISPRVRIAPSPTGALHVGNARAVLFNYFFSQKNQGKLILRIEDTDTERSEKRWEEDIIENLKWLGISWDEGPYRQSERTSIYKNYLEKLLKEKKAYYCFCTEEELEAKKQYQISMGQPPKYNGKCSQLSDEEVKKNLSEGKSSIIRFSVSAKKIIFNDAIRGKVEFDSNLIGDLSIAKDLNTPLYNFAVVVDDFEMGITHVIRGEDHISNTPKQILIQEALDFPRPEYAHLPLILAADKSKLSKRHGSVAVTEYRKLGYLPEAMVNFMAFLGWNPGTEREIFHMRDLIKEFSFENVGKSGAVFNIKRLDWLNGFYIRQKSIDKLTELCLPYLIEEGLITPVFKSEQYPPGYGGYKLSQTYKVTETEEEITFEKLKKIVLINQERLKTLSEIIELSDFFFRKTLNYEKSLLKWKDMTENEISGSLDKLSNILSKIDEKDFNKGSLEKVLLKEANQGKDRGAMLWPLRVSLTGKKASASPFEIADILGKNKTIKRVGEAKNKL